MGIETHIEIIVEVRYDTTGDRDAKPEEVDKNKQLVLHQIPDSNEKVIFYHNQDLNDQ